MIKWDGFQSLHIARDLHKDWIESFAGMKMDIGGTITEWNPHIRLLEAYYQPVSTIGWLEVSERRRGTWVTRYSDNQLFGNI